MIYFMNMDLILKNTQSASNAAGNRPVAGKGVHAVALGAAAAMSFGLIMSYIEEMDDFSNILLAATAVATVAVGYFRPWLSLWIRVTSLFAIFLPGTFTDDMSAWLGWCSVLLCAFAMTIGVRRIAMLWLGDERTANKSTLRNLYGTTDEMYSEVAKFLEERFHLNFKTMIPVAHTAAAMAVSLLVLLTYTLGNSHHMANWGYYLYLAVIGIISFAYAVKETKSTNEFLKALLTAFVMAVMGIIITLVCILIAFLTILLIKWVISAIFNFLHKLFGKD